ncbi:MAG: hypothetical protein WAL16_04010 [Streptosporangiaceae bacterium]
MRGIRYFSHLPGTGQGDSAQEYLSALRAAGVPVAWTPLAYGTGTWGDHYPLAPVPGPPADEWRHRDIAGDAVDCDTAIVHSTPLWPPAWALDPGIRRLACTTFEADRLPARWLAILSRYDGVLVPSRHSQRVCRDSGLSVPVTVVPHIAAPASPNPAGPNPASRSPASPNPASTVGTADFGLPAHTMVFYLIATWTMRKAVPDAVRAFLNAFTAADAVALVLKTSEQDRVTLRSAGAGPHAGMSWFSLARLLAGYPAPPPIRLMTGDVSPEVIAQLHARGDCFVSLSRGEGWNLGAFDAGAAGNPVVVTGWGGHLDYLPDGYPYCVRYDLVPTTADAPDDWFEAEPGQRWARADIGHASSLLREIYSRRQDARRWGQLLQRHILANFTAERITPLLLAGVAAATIRSGCDPSSESSPRRADPACP